MKGQKHQCRRGDYALGALLSALIVVVGVLFMTVMTPGSIGHGSNDARALVQELGLTDLCLFTEARYTRHPSQADLHTAFQDHPMALERFPSGTLLAPPDHATIHAPLDR